MPSLPFGKTFGGPLQKMIDLQDLKSEHVGRWVRYRDAHFPNQSVNGRIKSWNDHTVFVVYKCDNQWQRFADFTAAGTSPESLDFIEPPAQK